MKKGKYSASEEKYLIENYPYYTNKELSIKLNRTIISIRNFAVRHKLFKKIPNTGCFSKSHVPFNKGKKHIDYLQPDKIEAIKKTQFKKGDAPHNKKKYGEIYLRNESGKLEYWIKLDKPKPMRIYTWELHNGKVPKGHNVIFIDKTNNYNIENLKMVSNKELMEMNSMHQYPKELKNLIIIKNKLKKVINEKN